MLRHRRQKEALSPKVGSDEDEGSLEFALGNWSVITGRETADDIRVRIFAMEIAIK